MNKKKAKQSSKQKS